MNYVLCPSHNPLWGNVATALARHGFHARDVVCYPSQLREQTLPSQDFRWHDMFPLMLGQIDGVKLAAGELAALHERFDSRGIERQCLDMIGRLERYTFLPHHERLAMFRLFVAAAHDILRNDPAFILFAQPPHFPFNYVLREVARARGVPIVEFNSNPVAPTVFCTIDDRVIPAPQIQPEPWVAETMDAWLQRASRDYSVARPAYMAHQKKKHRLLRFDRIAKALRKRRHQPGDDRERLWLEYRSGEARSAPRPHAPLGHAITVRRARQALLEFYESRARPLAAIPKPFVYMPLHFQPERTSNPEGGPYYDQLEVALHVRRLLPKDMHLAIREHPSQFMMMRYALGYRSQNYYRALESLDGVSLLSTREDPFAVTDAAAELVTIAGTAALEAVLRGTPASYLGAPWFRGAPGVVARGGDESLPWAAPVASNAKVALRDFLWARVACQPLAAISPSNSAYWKTTVGFEDRQAQPELMAEIVAREIGRRG